MLFLSCEKEITPPVIVNSDELLLGQQTQLARQYARVQNYMNDFLTTAFSGAIAQPAFYGMNMASTPTVCPATQLSANGDILTLQFGDGPASEKSCSMSNIKEIGGTLVLNKNFCSNISSTRGCQPGSLVFDELYVQGCIVEAVRANGEEDLHPTFYSLKECPSPNSGTEEIVDFWLNASEEWEMKFTNSNSKTTIFNPINNYNGAFMHIKAPNIFDKEINFEDLYNASYQISLLRQGRDHFNEVIFKGAGQNGDDLKMLVTTTEDLVYTPYQCKNIIAGKVILMDLDFKPLMCIDYGVGATEADTGECDNIVKICPCDEWGDAIVDSPNCMVTGCLPL